MPLRTFFDHEVAIWRAVKTVGTLGEEVRTYVRVLDPPGRNNAHFNRPGAITADVGPGLGRVGPERGYMAPATDVLVRDLIEFVAGPDAGRVVEVDGPPTRPGGQRFARGHHVQLDCRLWHGTLPAAS